ncbi:MAG: hypothetical protein ACRDRI_03740 [Pseudonocardiaceae bacterium]
MTLIKVLHWVVFAGLNIPGNDAVLALESRDHRSTDSANSDDTYMHPGLPINIDFWSIFRYHWSLDAHSQDAPLALNK